MSLGILLYAGFTVFANEMRKKYVAPTSWLNMPTMNLCIYTSKAQIVTVVLMGIYTGFCHRNLGLILIRKWNTQYDIKWQFTLVDTSRHLPVLSEV